MTDVATRLSRKLLASGDQEDDGGEGGEAGWDVRSTMRGGKFQPLVGEARHVRIVQCLGRPEKQQPQH